MVSQSENVPVTTTTGTVTDDRGITEQGYAYTPATSTLTTGYTPSLIGRYHSFWGSVVAGTVAAISLSVLSYALMFAVRVGINNPTGDPSFGWGNVVWSGITAAIAFFLGGMIASLMMPLDRHGWIHGFTVWSLSVPLVLILTSFVAIGTSLSYGGLSGGPTVTNAVQLGYMPTIIHLTSGAAWMLFISLGAGLLFSILGGLVGGNRDLMYRKDVIVK